MRLRTLETNVGTVLVLDRMTPAEAATAAQASIWPDRDPRPFVLGVVGDVEIPGVDPVGVAEPSAPGLAEALERARIGRPLQIRPDPKWHALRAAAREVVQGVAADGPGPRRLLDDLEDAVSAVED